MGEQLEIGHGSIKANGPFAITILVLCLLVAALLYQHYYFMSLQMTKFDEATWVMSLPDSAKACVHLEAPVSMRSRLTGLPDLQREVVVRKHCQGRTLAEIADDLGRTVPAAASLLRRGLQQLRERLRDEE